MRACNACKKIRSRFLFPSPNKAGLREDDIKPGMTFTGIPTGSFPRTILSVEYRQTHNQSGRYVAKVARKHAVVRYVSHHPRHVGKVSEVVARDFLKWADAVISHPALPAPVADVLSGAGIIPKPKATDPNLFVEDEELLSPAKRRSAK